MGTAQSSPSSYEFSLNAFPNLNVRWDDSSSTPPPPPKTTEPTASTTLGTTVKSDAAYQPSFMTQHIKEQAAAAYSSRVGRKGYGESFTASPHDFMIAHAKRAQQGVPSGTEELAMRKAIAGTNYVHVENQMVAEVQKIVQQQLTDNKGMDSLRVKGLAPEYHRSHVDGEAIANSIGTGFFGGAAKAAKGAMLPAPHSAVPRVAPPMHVWNKFDSERGKGGHVVRDNAWINAAVDAKRNTNGATSKPHVGQKGRIELESYEIARAKTVGTNLSPEKVENYRGIRPQIPQDYWVLTEYRNQKETIEKSDARARRRRDLATPSQEEDLMTTFSRRTATAITPEPRKFEVAAAYPPPHPDAATPAHERAYMKAAREPREPPTPTATASYRAASQRANRASLAAVSYRPAVGQRTRFFSLDDENDLTESEMLGVPRPPTLSEVATASYRTVMQNLGYRS